MSVEIGKTCQKYNSTSGIGSVLALNSSSNFFDLSLTTNQIEHKTTTCLQSPPKEGAHAPAAKTLPTPKSPSNLDHALAPNLNVPSLRVPIHAPDRLKTATATNEMDTRRAKLVVEATPEVEVEGDGAIRAVSLARRCQKVQRYVRILDLNSAA